MQDFLRLFVVLAAIFTALGVVMVVLLHQLTKRAARVHAWWERRQDQRWLASGQMSDDEWMECLASPPPAFEPPIFEDESVDQPPLFDQDATAVHDTPVVDQDSDDRC